jgi:uncharacterized membrane protein YeaQ/YmgE (transglycosylase-associated protein family)
MCVDTKPGRATANLKEEKKEEKKMMAMNFPEFVTVLVLGLVSAFVFHVLMRYRVLEGVDGFMAEWIVGFIGGWIGPAIVGHWGLETGGLYFIPAVLGAFAGPFLAVAAFKARAVMAIATPRQAATVATQSAPMHVDMRKAS